MATPRFRQHTDGRFAVLMPTFPHWAVFPIGAKTPSDYYLTDPRGVHGDGWTESMLLTERDAFDLVDQAIGMFLENRDQHGQDESQARRRAAREAAEGVMVDADGGSPR